MVDVGPGARFSAGHDDTMFPVATNSLVPSGNEETNAFPAAQ